MGESRCRRRRETVTECHIATLTLQAALLFDIPRSAHMRRVFQVGLDREQTYGIDSRTGQVGRTEENFCSLPRMVFIAPNGAVV